MSRFAVERTCRACRSKRDKKELLRLVVSAESVLEADPRQRKPGRGWYLCPAASCLSVLQNPKLLRKAFGRPFQPGRSLQGLLNNPPVGGMHGQSTRS